MLASFPSSASVFLPGGQAPKPGERFKQTDLARTLKTVAEKGPDAFYRGEIGKAITDYLQANGGAMALSDYAEHETTVCAPISTTYRGQTVFQTGTPSQGLILLESLNILENFDLTKMEIGTAPWIHLQVEAKKLAYADRLGHIAHHPSRSANVAKLLDKGRATKRAKAIDLTRANNQVDPCDLADGDTTYLCVVDGNGMMVSLIQSVSAAFGCGMVAGETGVVLNNRVGRGFSLVEGHPNIFEPGKKTMHTLNCFMIADESDRMVITGGTPGGDGQPQWNMQMVSAMIDAGLDVQAAIEVPRWTSWPGTDPDVVHNPFELRIESRADEIVITGLENLGHNIKLQGEWNGGGTAQIIARDPETGVLAGGTDPREEGQVLGF
jgi:gamma-glutamyltranspeptidase/glutathione hydrolase